MAGEQIEHFVLPRTDWYDSDGRIYKDALIENFNAIEAKLKQIAELDAFETELPDISTITYDDVTLDSADNKIINLKSFLEMTGLMGYPIEMVTSGKTVKKLCFWDSKYNYKQLLDKSSGVSKTNKYLYLNYVDDKLVASDSSTTPDNCSLIGCYVDGIIKHVNGFDYAGINAEYYLSKMRMDTLDVSMENDEQFREHGIETGHNVNGATVCGTDLDTKSGSHGTVRSHRIGRTSA